MMTLFSTAIFVFSLALTNADLPEISEGAQAVSLMGQTLQSSEAGPAALAKLNQAEWNYQADSYDADNIIWYARRTAYTGDYRGAIRIFSEGIEKFPDDARMYRHRGHRYISIREFDRAIADLEHAAKLIKGKKNDIEPDGLPNAMNIPVSSLHGNIWYHLGLAYYLKQDWPKAYSAFQSGYEATNNDDNVVSTTHWLYMIKRRMGDEAGAATILQTITRDMDIIENFAYHDLCLFYKGEKAIPELLGDGGQTPADAAVAYGLANWYFYTGQEDMAEKLMHSLLTTGDWAAFGFIAAEADSVAR